MEKPRIKRTVFLFAFIALFLLVARLFYPFLTVLVWAGLIYVMISPLYERIAGIRGGSDKRNLGQSFIAGLAAFLGVAAFVVPILALAFSLARQILDIAKDTLAFLDTHPQFFDLSPASPLGGWIFRASGGAIDLSNFDVIGELKEILGGSSERILGFSTKILKNLGSGVLTVAFMMFTLYFLLVDGKHLIALVVHAIPIERHMTSMFLKKMRETGIQLVKGFFLVSLYQATVMFLLSMALGLKSPLVMAVLTVIASFVPMVGAGLVWGPLTIVLALTGPLWKAALFGILAALLVSTLDTFIRPMVLGERLKIHPLLIFFAILGGVRMFGINGLILGPLVLIVFFAAVDLYDKIESGAPSRDESEAPPEA